MYNKFVLINWTLLQGLQYLSNKVPWDMLNMNADSIIVLNIMPYYNPTHKINVYFFNGEKSCTVKTVQQQLCLRD